MLTALAIQNFVLIDQLSLSVGEGLTALTGETGAGKSILLDALGLAAGGRAERAAIRAGAEQGAVTAAFEVGADHPVWTILEENALPAGEDQIILRRVQARDGRSRAFVNDQPVSVALLRRVGESLVEIHGQHDGRGFLSAATHRALLDEYGGLEADRAALARLWRDWRAAADELDARRRGRERALAEADYLRHVARELEELDPQADEEAALASRRAELMAAEKIAGDLAETVQLVSEDGLEGRLGAAARRLARAAGKLEGDDNPVSVAVERIETALSALMDARAAAEDAADRLGHDPEELDRVETRLFALRAAARKHGVAPDGLPAFREKVAAALADLDAGEAGFEALEKRARAAERAYFDAAKALSAARRAAAQRLDAAVAKELAPLKLGRATFATRIETDADRPGADGIDQVEFMIAANPGAPAGPLKTIASGGELSRFVLAMKAALAAKENRTVIIFDEVDAGVGGAVADAVGERLARLAAGAQVLVVTHSPQVAARARHHFRIEKIQGKDETRTLVEPVEGAARVEEIARMLSGARVTDAARAAARQLLAGAQAGAEGPAATKKSPKKRIAS
ncbi:DNA repair protein RecN [Amphiplicatus metriothermophilus]|uniref:DNA repair protein RecN n=1 Tax=Amphiplicatus metriothermophilus TaxID=1519374 RepID=A0A239PSS4_9PROT|nr:DNA repair protein RecN [Amphiplicatus metriothermophilus]MBB5519265.1 DNA repair protein RecN (Recombination protein N) [Amphiplicatus metriothermophilus]SNT73334.1 DNA replication and repair protein RecN [Amphiplicatus metriothermophilus]